jgi:hypothetical protein
MLPRRNRIDKSVLTFGEPVRIRDEAYRRAMAGPDKPCIACGRIGTQFAHFPVNGHGGMGLKAGDDQGAGLYVECHDELDGRSGAVDRNQWLVENVLRPMLKNKYLRWLAREQLTETTT